MNKLIVATIVIFLFAIVGVLWYLLAPFQDCSAHYLAGVDKNGKDIVKCIN